MKIINENTSNSNSTSFLTNDKFKKYIEKSFKYNKCDECGEEFNEDSQICKCDENHQVCLIHIKQDEYFKKRYLPDGYERYNIPIEYCPVCLRNKNKLNIFEIIKDEIGKLTKPELKEIYALIETKLGDCK